MADKGQSNTIRISRDRYLAIGKEKIDKNPLTLDKAATFKRFSKKIWKMLGSGFGALIIQGGDKCRVCGTRLRIAPGQIVIYCGKPCRRKRHNSKR